MRRETRNTFFHPELVNETPETLLTLLQEQQQDKSKAENKAKFQRLQMLYLIKTGQIDCPGKLSEIIGCNRITLMRWLRYYQDHGLDSLLAIARPSRLKAVNWEINIFQDQIPESLHPMSLAKRLGVSVTVLSHHRHKRIFAIWTKHRDPDLVSWAWNPEDRLYHRLQ